MPVPRVPGEAGVEFGVIDIMQKLKRIIDILFAGYIIVIPAVVSRKYCKKIIGEYMSPFE